VRIFGEAHVAIGQDAAKQKRSGFCCLKPERFFLSVLAISIGVVDVQRMPVPLIVGHTTTTHLQSAADGGVCKSFSYECLMIHLSAYKPYE